jgi:hypothetical protein
MTLPYELTNGASYEFKYETPPDDDRHKGGHQKMETIHYYDLVRQFVNRKPDNSLPLIDSAFIQLSGFLALTLLRSATKDVSQMGNSFLKAQYRSNLVNVAGWGAAKPFYPPCERCVDHCVNGLAKTNSSLFCLC